MNKKEGACIDKESARFKPMTYLPMLLAFTAWLMLEPYFVWQTNVAQVCLLAILGICVTVYLYVENIKWLLSDVYLFCAFILFLLFFYRLGFNNGLNLAGLIIVVSSLAIFIVLPSQYKHETFKKFRYIFAVSLLPGMIVWLLYALGLPIREVIIGEMYGDQVLNSLKASTGVGYYVFPGSVVLDYWLDGGYPLYRLCAMYDEPGVVGTLAGLLLVGDRLNLSSKVNKILFFAGVMTFSLAFFMIVLLYVLTYYKLNKSTMLWLFILSIGVFYLLPHDAFEQFRALVGDRLSMGENGLAGDNRVNDLLDYYWQKWLNSGSLSLFIGLPCLVTGDIGSSWKSIVIMKGLIGLLGLLGVLLFFFQRFFSGYASVLFACVFILSIYQRPSVLVLPMMLVFVGGLIHLRNTKFIN